MAHQFTDAESTTIMNAVNTVVKLLQQFNESIVKRTLVNVAGMNNSQADQMIDLALSHMKNCGIKVAA